MYGEQAGSFPMNENRLAIKLVRGVQEHLLSVQPVVKCLEVLVADIANSDKEET